MAGDQVKEWCFNGDEETPEADPCDAADYLHHHKGCLQGADGGTEKEGIADKLEIDALAGFSLGEYSALTAAGAIDEISKGIDIVSKRGVMMQKPVSMRKATPKAAWPQASATERLYWRRWKRPERMASLRALISIPCSDGSRGR